MMVTCRGSKRDGTPCTATVEPPQEYCWWHDPANAERRRRAASKAGKSKPSREIVAIKGRLSDLADDLLAGRVDRADAAVVSQILNVYLRAITTELKIKEVVDLEERIAALEQHGGEGRRSWGA